MGSRPSRGGAPHGPSSRGGLVKERIHAYIRPGTRPMASTLTPSHAAASATGRAGRAAGDARASFLRARLASALAIAPLGVWTTMHLWNNLSAFHGPDAWQAAVTEYPHPFAQALTGIIVLLPLAIHVVWGIG